jgi:hypothetical protein
LNPLDFHQSGEITSYSEDCVCVWKGPVVKPGKTDAELKEEEELQLVLALSKETHKPS